jgi:hypothetical protein
MMNRTIPIIAFFAVSFTLVSCAGSKPYYSDSPFPKETSVTENINGNFPEAVYIKTRTQAFNTYHYCILHEGHIWYKSIDPQKEPKDWSLFMKTGLPHNDRPGFQKTNAVSEISADADELTALSAEGTIYSYCFDNTMANRANAWIDKQGWPIAEQFFLIAVPRITGHGR